MIAELINEALLDTLNILLALRTLQRMSFFVADIADTEVVAALNQDVILSVFAEETMESRLDLVHLSLVDLTGENLAWVLEEFAEIPVEVIEPSPPHVDGD